MISSPPFTVLSVCMGNICRSPMSERLLVLRVREALGAGGDRVDEFLLSHSCGLGAWHAGEGMTEQTARELRRRNADADGHKARQIGADKLDISDLILTATTDQVDYIAIHHPDALPRTFLVRQFGALVAEADPAALPAYEPTPEAVHRRGTAIVEFADAARSPAGEGRKLADFDLDDPWGLSDATYRRIGDELDAALIPFAALLTGGKP